MPQEPYHITALAPAASFVDAIQTHWREYLMEGAELAFFMLCVCTSGTLLYERNSPLNTVGVSNLTRSILMGVAVSAASYMIIRSPLGRRSGAHFNPALTFAYLGLGRIHRWDALGYIVAQFSGGLMGVFIAHVCFGTSLAGPPVRYVVTLPGRHGYFWAFLTEFLASFILMGIILSVSNHRRLARYSPFFVAIVTVFCYAFAASISGYSVNPARSFSSALFACIWNGIWIYLVAPVAGMLAAGALYKNVMGMDRIYCAKVFHDLRAVCPFNCRFRELQDASQVKVGVEHTH